MAEMDDQTLLRQYLLGRDERAFALMVGRYVDLVYSAARRQARGDEALAQDITQTVFIHLARKGGTIRRGEALAGWLLATTRFVALNATRAEARRRRHEREAGMRKSQFQSAAAPGEEPEWNSISGVLDEAIGKLKREDRDAVVLRYFQGLSAAEIGEALAISPEAAQKRISRAVNRLRQFFASRGVPLSVDGLAMVLGAHAVRSAPEALRQSLSSASRVTSHAAGGATSSTILGKGAVAIMTAAKAKLIAASAMGLLLVGFTGAVAYKQFSGSMSPRQVHVPIVPPTPTTLPDLKAPGWQAKVRAVYALKPGEFVRHVSAPFIPERQELYLLLDGADQYRLVPDGPDVFTLDWKDGNVLPTHRTSMFGRETVADLLDVILGIKEWDFDAASAQLLHRQVGGDWVVRSGVDPASLRQPFISALSRDLGVQVKLQSHDAMRDAIIIRGKFEWHPVTTQPGRMIAIYRGPTRRPNDSWWMDAILSDAIGKACNRPVILECAPLPPYVPVQIDHSADLTAPEGSPERARQIDELLAKIAKQTSLQMTRERRVLPIWSITTSPRPQ
jgi:RNA polymerase sigma factor (sigma-70 family)